MDYGQLTIPRENEAGTREINVTDYVKSTFQDGREVAIMGLEDRSVFIQISNPEESGRNPTNQLWLSEKSFFALQSLSAMYYKGKGIDSHEAIQSVLDGEILSYECSPNLTDKLNA